MNSRTCRMAATALVISGLVPMHARAVEPSTLDRCSVDDAARIRFLEERLDQRRGYADLWWKGWTAGYGIGTIVEAVEAGIEDDRGRKADYAVSAAKAAFGTTRLLLYPPIARKGADPMRAIEPVDAAACRDRLATGEALLRESAHESESRWSWKRHLANVAINVAGGVIVAEGFDESRGWTSMGIGIAVGEAMTFSHPWKGDDDLAEYERRFGGAPPANRVSFTVAPWRQGARIILTF
jgi:hypothetical protein